MATWLAWDACEAEGSAVRVEALAEDDAAAAWAKVRTPEHVSVSGWRDVVYVRREDEPAPVRVEVRVKVEVTYEARVAPEVG